MYMHTERLRTCFAILCLAFAAVIVGAATVAHASDYVIQRDAAMQLFKAREYEKALQAFSAMSQANVSKVQKSDALNQAIRCLIALERKDEAMKLTEQIPIEPEAMTCQMRVLSAQQAWEQIVTTFAKIDIDTWPDYLKSEAYSTRGFAAYRTRHAELAIADLTKAITYKATVNDRSLAINHLAAAYDHLLKDDKKAIETYRSVYPLGHTYKQAGAAIAVAGILTRQEKYDEAVKELETIDLEQVKFIVWKEKVLAAQGRALAAAGQVQPAIAKYQQILAIEDLESDKHDRYAKVIEGLKQRQADKP